MYKYLTYYINNLTHRNQSTKINNFVIFDSFNDKNYLEAIKGKIDLVSFGIIFVNYNLLTLHNYSTSQKSSILTLMQIATKEKLAILISMLEKQCESRLNFK